ncbi:hypothetical protein PLICRDRAFT_42112 [Plicaturopsis crispa FD-325 SS-3]|nr:hypothetical protein PLICRDRAFT_42112 [Plicaturopsis crispa FD-325 SS-3]
MRRASGSSWATKPGRTSVAFGALPHPILCDARRLPEAQDKLADPPLTPVYDSLTTNLPHPVMAFSSYDFPPSTPLYPDAPTVLRYLQDYATHFGLRPLLHFGARVDEISWDGRWKVRVGGAEQEFDFVVVANGHYRVPRYPDTPGLDEWLAAGKASHAAWYRHPNDKKFGRTVLVVGGGPSGRDISAELLSAGTPGTVIIHSATQADIDEGGAPEDADGNISNEADVLAAPAAADNEKARLKHRGRVVSFGSPESGTVTFQNGTRETGIDHCIIATGYEFSFPFFPATHLRPHVPPPCPPVPDALYNSTYHVFPLAKHIFPLQDERSGTFPGASIAFVGLIIRVAPFPLAEAQARAIARVFAAPDALDRTAEAVDIIARYEKLRASEGESQLAIAQAWPRFEEPEQWTYRDALDAFAGSNWRVRPWEPEIYAHKEVLRDAWRALERSGEAEAWVRGVGASGGEKGTEEWVAMMRKLLRKAEGERGKL